MQIEWNSVTWFTRVISYILLFVIFFLGFYFGGRYQDIQQIITSTQINSVKNVASVEAQKQLPRVYQNKNLGFQIIFPANWRKVVVNENKNGKSVDFSLMHNLGAYVKVFSLKKFNMDEWKIAQKGLFSTIEVARLEDYVFGYSLGQDDEGFVGFPAVVYGELYQGPYFEVQTKIIPTFSLIQDPS